MADNIDLGTFTFDIDEMLKETSNLKNKLDELKTAQAQLKKEGDTSSATFVKNAADIKNLSKEYNTNVSIISKNTKAVSDQANRTELLNVALSAEGKTIDQLRESNKALTDLRNSANLETEEGRKELQLLNAKLDENNELIKENVDEYTKQKINIGNYQDAIKGAFSDLNIMNGGLTGFIGRAQQAGGVTNLVSSSLRTATTAIKGMTKATLAFLATPIGAVIAAIGLALGLVINYLRSTQAGIDAVTSVTRPLMTIFESLIGVLQNVGKDLFEAFSNPKKTLEDLADFVKQNLINRFTAFGEILEGIINLDFKQIADGVGQAVTGVEGLTDKVTGAAKETAGFFTEAAQRGAEMDRLTKEIEKREISINKLNAIANSQMKELEVISKNTSLSIQERVDAANEIVRIAQDQADEEAAIIQLKIEKLKLDQQSNDTNREGFKELANLEAELINIQTRAKEVELRQIRVIADAAKQARTEAINFIKEELALYIASQGTRKKEMSEELAFAEEVSRRKIAIAEKEFENSEKKASDRIALERTIAEAENEFAQAQIDITIANANRELEIFKSTLAQKKNENSIFTEEYLAQERARNQALFEQEQEFAKLRLEQGLINQQEYEDAIRELVVTKRLENEELDKEVEEAKKSDKLEQDIAEFELEQERLAEQGATAFELEQERLDEKYRVEQEKLAANLAAGKISQENYNAQLLLLDKQHAGASEAISKAENAAKLDIAQQTLGGIAALLGEQTAAGKAAAIAQATINVYQGVTSVLAAPSLIPEPFGSIAKGIAAVGILASGLATVKKIVSVKAPKMEKGGIMQIKGKSHTQGGEPIYVGNQYVGEAEGDEGIGILNKRAFASFMNYNNKFANGGIIAPSNIGNVQDRIQRDFDQQQMSAMITQSVREGAREGTMTGSMEGSQQGIIGLTENRQVQANATL